MNEHIDIERVLERWFDDGPTRMPDRVVTVVADRIDRQRQRRPWRLQRRLGTMNLPLRLGAAALVVVLLAIVGFNLLPDTGVTGGSVATPTPSLTAPPSPSASPAPAATRWWSGYAGCGECIGYLAAGTATTRRLKPALTFTVPDGWINNYDNEDGFALLPDTEANRLNQQTGSATLHDLTVVRNVALGSSDCSGAPEAGVGTSARAITDGLGSRPGLETSEPIAVSVGGLSGYQVDIALTADWTAPCPGGDTAQVALFSSQAFGQGHFGAGPGDRFRFILLDVPTADGGGTLLIDIFAAQADAFAPHLAAAMSVVDSFAFDVASSSPGPS